jgi:thiol-disulfide isomerase/thioredoxin
MRDGLPRDDRASSRRTILLAAPALLGLASLRASRAQGSASSWPPVFETGRSQFTVVRPRELVPALRLQDLRGQDVLLTPKPGGMTLINFWATWCAACRLDLPVLASLARSRPDRLDIWAICTDTKDIRKTRAYLDSVNAPGLSCYTDPYETAAAPSKPSDPVFKLVGMPITYLVGTSHRIEGYITGAADWLSPSGARLLQFYREQG